MPYLRQLLLSFAFASFVACAAGVPGEDPFEFTADETTTAASNLDAGLPPLAAAVAPVAASAPSAPTFTGSTTPTGSGATATPSSSAGSMPNTSAQDAGTLSEPPTSTPVPQTPPATSPQDVGTSGTTTRDAGSSAPATPPPAPMCSPLRCKINCALLRPCCNQQNECMCLSPIRGCVLPPL